MQEELLKHISQTLEKLKLKYKRNVSDIPVGGIIETLELEDKTYNILYFGYEIEPVIMVLEILDAGEHVGYIWENGKLREIEKGLVYKSLELYSALCFVPIKTREGIELLHNEKILVDIWHVKKLVKALREDIVDSSNIDDEFYSDLKKDRLETMFLISQDLFHYSRKKDIDLLKP